MSLLTFYNKYATFTGKDMIVCMEEDMKKIMKEIFIDGLSGMASGLFATLIIGTIIVQIGNLIPGAVGQYLIMMGKVRT